MPNGVVLSDLFGRSVTGGWGTPDFGPTYTLDGGVGSNLSVTAGVGKITHSAAATVNRQVADLNVRDQRVEGRVRVNQTPVGASVDNIVEFRYVSASTSYRAYVRFETNNVVTLYLQGLLNGSVIFTMSLANAIVGVGSSFVRIRAEAVGAYPTRVRAKVWLDGTTEPSAWNLERDDSTADLQVASDLAVLTSTTTGVTSLPMVHDWDDIVVTDLQLAQHHVKIGDEYFLVRPFSYQKRAAPLFGARFSTGDPDYSNLSVWQHWAQTCWVGGIDADQWSDDAMYDEAVGVDSTVHEQLTLSRDLIRPTGGVLNATSLGEPRKFIVYRNDNRATNVAKLYCLTTPRATGGAADSHLWRWDGTVTGWVLVKTWVGLKARSIVVFAGKLVVGFNNATLQHVDNPAGTWVSVAAPTGVTGELTAMEVYQSKLYCAYLNKVYRRSADFSVDGSTVFYNAEAADHIVEMTPHLGFLYMLSNNSRVIRTDGNNTFDIWGWDNNTLGMSMASYDGRLFLATYEYTDTTDVGFGVLYQFSGSAVTQLKRFGAVDKATSLGQLMAYDRKLWFGASGLWGMNRDDAGVDKGGFGVAVYDAVEDSHNIWATNKDTVAFADASGVGRDWVVDDVIFFQGLIHISVRGHGLFRTPKSYRDYLRAQASYDTTAAAPAGGVSRGFLISSDYDAGTVGLKKLWRDITVHCDLSSTSVSITVDYSTDGGATWVTAGTITKDTSATRYAKVIKLNNVRANRLKYRLRLNTTTATRSPVVRGVVVSYLPLPEPNWMWDMTLVCSNTQEMLGGTDVAEVDARAKMEYLDDLFRSQELFKFIDLDGAYWTLTGPGCFLYDIQRNTAINGDAPSEEGLEGDVRVVILEAVEQY